MQHGCSFSSKYVFCDRFAVMFLLPLFMTPLSFLCPQIAMFLMLTLYDVLQK